MKKILPFVFACLFMCSFAARSATTTREEAAAQIDHFLREHWKKNGLEQPREASDETFVRRVYLDFAGRIPTPAESTEFDRSGDSNRRAALIQKLLNQESYVSNFFNYWSDILRYQSHYVNRAGVVEAAYRKYIKESLRANKPYDQFVRELLEAKGFAWDNGAVGYYLRDPEMPLDNMALTARVFMGTRIECAQCHDHPFDKWKQTEFYHLAAYTFGNRPNNEGFNGLRDAIRSRQNAIHDEFVREKSASSDGGKAAEQRKQECLDAMQYRKVVDLVRGGVGQLFSPVGLDRNFNATLKLPFDFKESDGKPHDVMKPATLMGAAAEIQPGQDPAEAFARWVASPENPRFTRVIVNRLWKKLFGVALTEPLDDLRDDSKSVIPELEAYLQKLMIEQRYDLRAFLATLATTKAYQANVSSHEYTRGEPYYFHGPALRRLTAEQIWDSVIALANHEPDARDLDRERAEDRRTQISRMTFEAYSQFNGEKLLDLAYANLQSDLALELQEKPLQEAIVQAKRNGKNDEIRNLQRQLGEITRERAELKVEKFILPILENLARIKVAPDAKPFADPLYVMHPNPRILTTEIWRKMHIPGYGPAPRSAEQIAHEKEATRSHRAELGRSLGISEKDILEFQQYCETAQKEWMRASEIGSPAPRGHFLRTMGQSDREFVENSNLSATIPQALLMMNGDIISASGVLAKYSPLMLYVHSMGSPQAKMEAVYRAILARKPTDAERRRWENFTQVYSASIEDLAYSLLNTKQFCFQQ